jgi:hypothetical protein
MEQLTVEQVQEELTKRQLAHFNETGLVAPIEGYFNGQADVDFFNKWNEWWPRDFPHGPLKLGAVLRRWPVNNPVFPHISFQDDCNSAANAVRNWLRAEGRDERYPNVPANKLAAHFVRLEREKEKAAAAAASAAAAGQAREARHAAKLERDAIAEAEREAARVARSAAREAKEMKAERGKELYAEYLRLCAERKAIDGEYAQRCAEAFAAFRAHKEDQSGSIHQG